MTHSAEQRTSTARFATTHWSVVLVAGRQGTPESREALNRLCRTYWQPVYAYLRRQRFSVHDAEDLTQGFFAKLLDTSFVEAATPQKGRFRSYLLGAVKHYVSKERDRARAKKRGGAHRRVPLDTAQAESRWDVANGDALTPDRIFERCWALTLLDRVLSRLEDEFVRSRRGETFSCLKDTLVGARSRSYKAVAEELGTTEGAVKVAVHRMRRRYRELLLQEVSETVAQPEQAEDEIRHLLAAVSD